MRQLASVQRVISVSPIPGADSIEMARVLGWNVVVKRGEYTAGDLVVYCEVDSILPERAEFEFLRKSCYRAPIVANGVTVIPGGFRIKTIKLRGQISQGICFPVSVLATDQFSEGDDATRALGVVKYDVDAIAEAQHAYPNITVRNKTFPWFIPRTDETRIQSCPNLLLRHRGLRVTVTEKLDGSSFTAFAHEGQIGICSRNQQLDTDGDGMMEVWARNHGLIEKMETLRQHVGHDFAVQGEFIGPKVQGNKYAQKEHSVMLFSSYNISTGTYMNHAVTDAYALALSLATVPVLYENLLLPETVEKLVTLATRRSTMNRSMQAEGIVVRGVAVTQDEKLGWVSFKVINPEFCLRYE